jgi:holin-like protein
MHAVESVAAPYRGAPSAEPEPGAGRPVAGLRPTIGPALALGLRLARQFAILSLLFGIGSLLVQRLGLPLPGNLVGMLLLLLLLHLGVVRTEQLQDLTTLALRHLNFFFVPFAVGLMTWTTLLATSGPALGLSLVGSALVGLLTAGLVGQVLAARGGGCDDA